MSRSLSALTINVGKAGVTESLIEEVRRQLKANELIKVRFTRTVASEKESYITEIVEKTNSKLIDLRGNVAIIFKKRS
ncbi:YhbY family RNA-binding protein [Methanothermobacter sp. DP]|uniref:YhbY family RNA-binding protein n=1 Tax=Methanothermobacter sp. DP TaxID=2998972 RepID=UPI002AA5D717|nr:YhbY family RNA-binding protein [Methanothermobacter sp. DP]